jgi:hypothetical protein
MSDITYELVEYEDNEIKKQLDITVINRYYLSKMYKQDLEVFFETWDSRKVPDSSADRVHVIQVGEEGRWDLISYKYYQTVKLWWFICLANGIRNPLITIPAGSAIRIPDFESLRFLDRSYLDGVR